jgi:2-hydroxychromene-2-carboxylate isomerase
VRIAIADETGYDGAALQALERSDPVQAAYAAYTDEAVRLGVFGAPTFVLDGERFWGQDRLAFVDRALAMRAAGIPAG